jgi:hypothetical protein
LGDDRPAGADYSRPANFFTAPTFTCPLLFLLVVLAHDPPSHPPRQRHAASHVGVDMRQQLPEALPWCVTARDLLHDRDAIFDGAFRDTVDAFVMTEVRTAPRSPGRIATSSAHRVDPPRVP